MQTVGEKRPFQMHADAATASVAADKNRRGDVGCIFNHFEIWIQMPPPSDRGGELSFDKCRSVCFNVTAMTQVLSELLYLGIEDSIIQGRPGREKSSTP